MSRSLRPLRPFLALIMTAVILSASTTTLALEGNTPRLLGPSSPDNLSGKTTSRALIGPQSESKIAGNASSLGPEQASGDTSTIPRLETIVNLTPFSQPTAVAVDDSGDAFVAEGRTNSVAVVSGSPYQEVSVLAVGIEPEAVMYDSGTNEIFVSNHGSNNVTVISASTLQIRATVNLSPAPQGTGPTSMAYDNSTHEVFVANPDTDNISVISDVNDSVIATIRLGAPNTPESLIYDWGRQQIVELNYTASGTNLTFLSDSTYQVVAQVAVANATSLAYDPASSEIFVATNSDNVSVVSDSSHRVVRTMELDAVPSEILYDVGTGDLFSASYAGSGDLEVVSANTGTHVASFALSGDPNSRFGLAYDNETALVLVPVQNTTTGNAAVDAIFDGSPTYTIEFEESGLPVATSWGVTIGGVDHRSSTGSLNLSELNGTFQYTIDQVLYWKAIGNATGRVSVRGSAIIVMVPWERVAWLVEFTGMGLSAGSRWSIALNGSLNSSQSPSIGFTEPNGSYPYSVTPEAGWQVSPSSGEVVVNGYNVSVPVVWTRITYSVAFSEHGLPSGTNWTVRLGGVNKTSNMSSVSFALPNGSAPYVIGAIPGWQAAPWQGTIRVSGEAISVTVRWNQTTYPIQLRESGLPSGTSWSATINGTNRASTSQAISWEEPNGSYPFSVGSVAGFNSSPSRGTVLVSGTPSKVTVIFSPIVHAPIVRTPPSRLLGLPAPEGYALLGGAVLTVAAVIAAIAWFARRQGGSKFVSVDSDVNDGSRPNGY